jgi:hypothetical protein
MERHRSSAATIARIESLGTLSTDGALGECDTSQEWITVSSWNSLGPLHLGKSWLLRVTHAFQLEGIGTTEGDWFAQRNRYDRPSIHLVRPLQRVRASAPKFWVITT